MNTYMLFAIFGASGAGKTEIFRIIRQVSKSATVHRKKTTRPPRRGESRENRADLEHVTQINPDECVVVYHKFDHYYGITKDQITAAHINGEMHFIIVRDTNAIRKLKQRYPELVVIYVHSDPNQIERNLQKREGIAPHVRRRRVGDDFHEYVENITLFDHVVVNFWEIDYAVKQIENIIGAYQKGAASILA